MPNEADIVYETKDFWVLRTKKGIFEVYRTGITHSTRCAIIGYRGQVGESKAKAEADRRQAEADQKGR